VPEISFIQGRGEGIDVDAFLDEVVRHGFELILQPVPFPRHVGQVT